MKIRIDIRPMASTLHREWDGEQGKTFKNFLRRKENIKRINDKLNKIINNENIIEIKHDLDERYTTIEFNNFVTLNEIHLITNELTRNDLIAYKM
jgi:hypothetical protein